MKVLLICTIVYFFLGIAVLIFSVWPSGNKFSRFMVKKFSSANHLNKFMMYCWIYPCVALSLLLMILQAF